MDNAVGGTQVSLEGIVLLPPVVAYPAARFLDQKHTRSRVVRPEIMFKIAIEPAAGRLGEIKQSRCGSPQIGTEGHHVANMVGVVISPFSYEGETRCKH